MGDEEGTTVAEFAAAAAAMTTPASSLDGGNTEGTVVDGLLGIVTVDDNWLFDSTDTSSTGFPR